MSTVVATAAPRACSCSSLRQDESYQSLAAKSSLSGAPKTFVATRLKRGFLAGKLVEGPQPSLGEGQRTMTGETEAGDRSRYVALNGCSTLGQ